MGGGSGNHREGSDLSLRFVSTLPCLPITFCFAMQWLVVKLEAVCANTGWLAVNTNCFITPRELSPHKIIVKLWENLSEKQNNLIFTLWTSFLLSALVMRFHGVIQSLWRWWVVSVIVDVQNSETPELNVLQIFFLVFKDWTGKIMTYWTQFMSILSQKTWRIRTISFILEHFSPQTHLSLPGR